MIVILVLYEISWGISNQCFEQLLWTTQALNDFILESLVIHFVLCVSMYYYIESWKKPLNHSKGFQHCIQSPPYKLGSQNVYVVLFAYLLITHLQSFRWLH